jgi:alkaline phosphatase
MKKYLFLILVSTTLACTSSTVSQPASSAGHPRNIIFLIGDGMGLSEVSTGFYFGEGPSQFLRFGTIGLQRTSSATHKITDSGASGTALSTGTKTYNGAIGMDTLKNPVTDISELVSELGWETGVVVTSSVTHATPASFYAHVEQRNMEDDIAIQLLDSPIDFFAGGGIRFFHDRTDGQDLLPLAEEKGFVIDTTSLISDKNLAPDKKYGFLLADEKMPPADERGDFLPNATALALHRLSDGNNRFFLMVEGSQIDMAGHANNAESLIGEMLDFEKVIKVAMDFAEKDGNTLVVVTADHETGGFALSGPLDKTTGQNDYSKISPSFATGGHSATLIPVFAYGPGADRFTGIYENTAIFEKMAALASGK